MPRKRAGPQAPRPRKRKPAAQVVKPQGIEAGSIVGDVTLRVIPQAEMTFEASLPHVESQIELSTVTKLPVLTVDPADRIILSGDRLTREQETLKKASIQELENVRDVLKGLRPYGSEASSNRAEIPMSKESYEVLCSVVESAISLQKAPVITAEMMAAQQAQYSFFARVKEVSQGVYALAGLFGAITLAIVAFQRFAAALGVTFG